MVIMSTESACIIVQLKTKLSFPDYKLLAEWLGGYQFNASTPRCLYYPTEFLSFFDRIKSSTDIYTCWVSAQILEQHTRKVQREVIQWILD